MLSLKITAKSTALKSQPIQSTALRHSEKITMQSGESVTQIESVVPAKNQHWELILKTAIFADDRQTTLKKVYVYEPHVKLDGASNWDSLQVKLDVPYYQQNDNDTAFHGQGWRQCNLTSHAMLVDALLDGALLKKFGSGREPESVYGRHLARYSDTTNHDGHTRCLKEVFGIDSYWSHTLSLRDILMQIALGIPVVMGMAYKSSGHIVLCTGCNVAQRFLYIHDPFGVRLGSSNQYDVGADGAYDKYKFDTLDSVFWDGGKEAGWGRIVTAINGKPTSMKNGL